LLKFLVAVFGTLALFYAGFNWWTHGGVFSTARFDQTQWLAKVPEQLDSTCYRGNMAYDIRDRVLRSGMAAQQVLGLLGRPDFHSPAEFRYVLGMCSGLGFDYDDLHVFFNPQGRVERVQIIQH